jgi:hypothetical protein
MQQATYSLQRATDEWLRTVGRATDAEVKKGPPLCAAVSE